MTGNARLVVGDSYHEFAEHDDVLTFTQAKELLEETRRDLPATLVLGQGMSSQQLASLEALAKARGSVFLGCRTASVAPLALTHKHFVDNVMMTAPIRVAPGKYTTDMLVNNAIDRLSDHVTGQHLGGMLLIEVSRQFGTACLELEFGDEKGLALLWSELEAKFLTFAFPVPTQLALTISQAPASDPKHQAMRLDIEITQSGTSIAQIVIGVSVLSARDAVVRLEKRRAEKAARKAVTELPIPVADNGPVVSAE